MEMAMLACCTPKLKPPNQIRKVLLRVIARARPP